MIPICMWIAHCKEALLTEASSKFSTTPTGMLATALTILIAWSQAAANQLEWMEDTARLAAPVSGDGDPEDPLGFGTPSTIS